MKSATNTGARRGLLRRVSDWFRDLTERYESVDVLFAVLIVSWIASWVVLIGVVPATERNSVDNVRDAVQTAAVDASSSPAETVGKLWAAVAGDPDTFLQKIGIDDGDMSVTYRSYAGTANDELVLTRRAPLFLNLFSTGGCISLPKTEHGAAAVAKCVE